MYTHGISREGDLLDLALADKLVEKSGSWFNYGDLRLGQGRENAKQYLRDNPEIADEIAARIIANRQRPRCPSCQRRTDATGRRGRRGMRRYVLSPRASVPPERPARLAPRCSGATGRQRSTRDSEVSGTITPGRGVRHGEEGLDQAVNAGRAGGCAVPAAPSR